MCDYWQIYVPLPDKQERVEMVELFTKQLVGKSVCEAIGAQTELYSGSDLKSVCKELVMSRIRASVSLKPNAGKIDIKKLLKDFSEQEIHELLSKVKPSPCCDLNKYAHWAQQFGSI